jgi:hypothetical protein
MPPVSVQVEVIEGETPAGLLAGSILNIYDSCNLQAAGITDPLVRSVLVQASGSNTGQLLVGYRTNDPKNPGAISYGAVEGKWYDLRKVVVKLGATGDTAIFSATR